jgi:protein SCO1/2
MSSLRFFAFTPLVVLLLLAACQQEKVTAPDIDFSFDLVDESGNAVTESTYAGHLQLVFFGFTSCPDICPVTLHNIAAALKSMDAQASDVKVLFISIDPKTDTPERLKVYTTAIHPAIVGLTGSYDQLLNVTEGFRTTFGFSVTVDGQAQPLTRAEYEALPASDAYVPYHSSQVYLVGPDGTLLDIIGYGSKPTLIAETLTAFL